MKIYKITEAKEPPMKLTDEQILQAALDAGFMVSTAYGQQEPKLMPVSDKATLCDFAKRIAGMSPTCAGWTRVEDANIEELAAAVHRAYCDNHIERTGKPYWTHGDYSILDEATKEIDRATVRAVLNAMPEIQAPDQPCRCAEMEGKLRRLASLWNGLDEIHGREIDDIDEILAEFKGEW